MVEGLERDGSAVTRAWGSLMRTMSSDVSTYLTWLTYNTLFWPQKAPHTHTHAHAHAHTHTHTHTHTSHRNMYKKQILKQ